MQQFLSVSEEEDLLGRFEQLEFQQFDFQGYIAKRRIVEYGFEYNFSSRRAGITDPIPEFLSSYQQRAACWVGIAPREIVQAVITQYSEGSPIGWHRDGGV